MAHIFIFSNFGYLIKFGLVYFPFVNFQFCPHIFSTFLWSEDGIGKCCPIFGMKAELLFFKKKKLCVPSKKEPLIGKQTIRLPH